MNIQDIAASLLQKIDDLFEGSAKRVQYLKRRGEVWRALHIYGYECRNRGWDLKPEFIWRDLMNLIMRLDVEQINDLPTYLAAAIRKHLGRRAEELSAEAKANREVPRVVERVVEGKKVVEFQETSVEWLDRACRTRKAPKPRNKQTKKQLNLL